RAACVSISHNRYLTPFVPEPARRMTWSSEQVNRFILPHRARNGREPFFVLSHPGIATEKRPAVPPATTTWISSVDGNFEIIPSGSGTLSHLPSRTFVPSPWSASGDGVGNGRRTEL